MSPLESSQNPSSDPVSAKKPPYGLKWRSSYWFTTFVVWLGILTDLLVYSIIIPVMPFQLEKMGLNNVSSLAGWLLFAYSAGLVVSTIPIAQFSERHGARRMPLIVGLFILLGSQIMMMEAPNYAVMCVARALQGFGSSMVWVVGLALLCDCTPEQVIGRQLGIATSGLSVGVVIGPPVGGALYDRFGFRGPFIFCIGVIALDLIGRLVIIERNDALKWGADPAAPITCDASEAEKAEASAVPPLEGQEPSGVQDPGRTDTIVTESCETTPSELPATQKPKRLSLLAVLLKLAFSSRAITANIITFVYGVAYTSQEPSLPVHLNNIWGLDPGKVGLVYLAAVIPTAFSSAIAGYGSDKYGTEWVTLLWLVLAVPWWFVVTIERQLALFIVAFAFEGFFTSAIISPLTAEFASVARGIEGVGYAHVYGVFNIAYGIGSAVGPVIGGQLFDNIERGWLAQCALGAGVLAACAILSVFFTGQDPLWNRLLRAFHSGKGKGKPEALPPSSLPDQTASSSPAPGNGDDDGLTGHRVQEVGPNAGAEGGDIRVMPRTIDDSNPIVSESTRPDDTQQLEDKH